MQVRLSRAQRQLMLAVVLLVGTVHALAGSAHQASGASPDIVMWGHRACPHCREAYAYLDGLRSRLPDRVIVEHDVSNDADALEDLDARTQTAGLKVVGLPALPR